MLANIIHILHDRKQRLEGFKASGRMLMCNYGRAELVSLDSQASVSFTRPHYVGIYMIVHTTNLTHEEVQI